MASGAYPFSLQASDAAEGCFLLHVRAAKVSIEDEVLSELNIFSLENHIQVDFSNLEGPAQIEVFNLVGQLVATAERSSETLIELELPAGAAQTYLVRVQSQSGVFTQKVMVR